MKQKILFFISLILNLLVIIITLYFGYMILTDLKYPTIHYYKDLIFPFIMLAIYIMILIFTFKKRDKMFACISGFISLFLIIPFVILFVIGGFIIEFTFPSYSMTTKISNYGNYDRCVNESTIDIFPESLNDFMENAQFSYKLQWILDYAYEVYLEFSIEDETVFSSYIIETVNKIKSEYPDVVLKVLDYDSSYMELVIHDELNLKKSDNGMYISRSYVKKFIYNICYYICSRCLG